MFRRDNIKLIVIATVCLLVGLSAPAVGHGVHAQFAHNADTVDGKHAVDAGATVAQRQGKLVATNGTNGRLPNNIIAKAPDADQVDGINSPELQFPTTVPVNRTVIGSWGFDVNTDGTGDWGTHISYPAQMPTQLSFHFIPSSGAPTAACPGNADEPKASPGNVCVYGSIVGTNAQPQGFTTRFGLNLWVVDDGAAGDLFALGTWAATAVAPGPPGVPPANAPAATQTMKD